MATMTSVGGRHFHAGMWVSRLSVAFMSHVLHFETPKPEIDNLTDCAQVFVPNDEDITDGPSYNSYPLVQLPRRRTASRWDRFWIADPPGNDDLSDFRVDVGGFAGGQLIAETDDATFQRMFDLNLNCVFHILRATVPLLRQTGTGRIIANGSRSALEPGASVGAYGASKAAMVSLIRTVALEY